MDDFNKETLPEEPETNEEFDDEEDEYEMSHLDKMTGVFTSPSETFAEISKFPPKTTDWLFPVLALIVFVIISNFIMMSNPIIKQAIVEKQMEKIEKGLQDAVDSGSMTQEQADSQLETIQDNMDTQMGAGQVFQVIGTILGVFIVFFIVAGVYFIMAKFVLKGEGTYQSAMVALGLTFYISVLGTIVRVILALAMDKFFADTSVATFMSADTSTFMGFVLSKLDIFSIWSYAVIAIAFAKMFKSESTGKYYAMVFGLWIGFGLLFFYLGKLIPILSWMNG